MLLERAPGLDRQQPVWMDETYPDRNTTVPKLHRNPQSSLCGSAATNRRSERQFPGAKTCNRMNNKQAVAGTNSLREHTPPQIIHSDKKPDYPD